MKKVCPCIIPPDAQEPIKLLIENRAKGGIREDSQMVFGVPTSDAGYIPSHYVLKKFAKIYCDDPEKVTSTKLRKFLATACQMLDFQLKKAIMRNCIFVVSFLNLFPRSKIEFWLF